MNRNVYLWNLSRNPDRTTLTYYQNMGFSHNLIAQAWTECRGNQLLLLDSLVRLSGNLYHGSRIKRIPGSTIIKKMSIMKNINLKFQGDSAFKFLELRKLGLFSKKAFRNAKSLHLKYEGLAWGPLNHLQDKHIETLARNMNRGLRKLKHFSTKFDFDNSYNLDIRPLLRSIKETFVNLVSLGLSLKRVFEFSLWDLHSFERIFLYLSSSLKFLDLDFSENSHHGRAYFSEALSATIMKGLPRLEGLCLNFSKTGFSTRIVGQLISGAATHLTRLKRLYINLEKCHLDQVQWNSYNSYGRRLTRFSSNLQDLKLNFEGCEGLSLGFLSLLQSDIITFCPKLSRLFVNTLKCKRYSNEFYGILEEEFLRKLKKLKWFRLLYSYDLEKTLERYEELGSLEMKQTLLMKRNVAKIKQRAREEEEIGLYFKILIEEEQAPKGDELDEQEYLQNDFENKLFQKDDVEVEEQDRLDYVVNNLEGWVEEAKACVNENPFHESEFEYYEDCPCCEEERDYQIGQHEKEWKEQDLQDRMEEEIRFRDLTQGGRVNKISLNYGDDL